MRELQFIITEVAVISGGQHQNRQFQHQNHQDVEGQAPGVCALPTVSIPFHWIHDKEDQTLLTFLTTENLSGLSCSHECKYGAYSDLFSYAVNLPG